MTAVVLVEGLSDRVALETLATRRGLDLAEAGIEIVSIGGAGNVARVLDRTGATPVVALCDAGEERQFRRAGVAAADLFVCDADLEDELIRTLGSATVEQLLEAQGELDSFRTFQKQPAQRARAIDAQLHR